MSSAGMGGNGPRPPEGDGFAPKTFGGPAAGGGRDPYGGHPVGAPTGHFGGPSGPRGPSGPSGPTGPTGPNSHGSGPKRTWALALVALGCIGAMVLVVGGGITFLALNQSGGEEVAAPLESESATTEPTSATETDSETDSPSSSAAETTEPPEFEVLSPIDRPQGDADDIWAVLEDNPLTDGSLPALGSCDLPETPVEHSAEELQAVLDAAGDCLNQLWATASSDRGLPWHSPEIVVYSWPDVPTSSCEEDTFEEDFPRVCNLDYTIYWPEDYGRGAEQTDPELVAPAYLWDLSYMYMIRVAWDSSVGAYYSGLDGLVGKDEDLGPEVWRRYNLQMHCLSAAATMQVPEQSRPPQEFRDALTDENNWSAGDPPRSIEPSSRVHWLAEGFGSDGELSVCNTWEADADLVA